MTGEVITGSDTEQAAIDAQLFIAEHGLQEVAAQQIQGPDGKMYSVEEAIVECRPFAEMIGAMAIGLKDVPNKEEVMTNTIRGLAARTSHEPPKKKLN